MKETREIKNEIKSGTSIAMNKQNCNETKVPQNQHKTVK
jgi:hypothetical protein